MKPATICFSLLASAIAAGPAFACPGPEDMETGVIFTLDDGGTETHRRFAEDWVLIQSQFSDGEGTFLETSHGLYLHSSTPIENGVIQLGQKDVFTTRPEMDAWDVPKPDATWSNETEGGGTATSGAVRTIQLGTCSYEAFDVALTYNDDPNYEETYHYLPELGVGLLVATVSDGSEDRYTYTEVSAVE